MNKTEFIIRQLARTKHKKFEQYVVTGIIHKISNIDLKFVTQQYVNRPEGRALTDLFFPQLNLHIEVDEAFHKNNVKEDELREQDIIDATNHEIIRVDASVEITSINSQIDDVVQLIKDKVESLGDEFIPWDIDKEFSSEFYVKKGYISLADNVTFKTIKDACNCFGHNYSGYQKAGANHPDPNILLWFPKLYPNGKWDNKISNDENTIFENSIDLDIANKHIHSHIHQLSGEKHIRIVFARVKDNLGFVLYRFKGLYKLNLERSCLDVGLVWERESTEVLTYSYS